MKKKQMEFCYNGKDFSLLWRLEQEDSKCKEGEDKFCRKEQHDLGFGLRYIYINYKKCILKFEFRWENVLYLLR